MTVTDGWRAEAGEQGLADSLYARLRSLERRTASEEDYRVMLADFFQQEPAVRAAMPAFSAFGLLEAIRTSQSPEQRVEVGEFSATTTAGTGVLRRLSIEDVSLSHPWYSPNHPYFAMAAAICGGLFFGFATPSSASGVASLLVGAGGAIACFLIASLVRYLMRNSTRRSSHPQWVCALHVDRHLQAYHRGLALTGMKIENLPNPGVRRKAPFYDLHNQIVAGGNWAFHAALRDTPPLTFPPRPTP